MKTLSGKLGKKWGSHEINLCDSFSGRILSLFVLMAVLLSVGSAVGYAQVDTGSIQGQVEDGSHAVIPNASVVLKSENTGVTQSTKSDAQGEFTFSPVRIGVYTLTVTAGGFQKSVSQHIQLEVQQQLRVPVVLQPGSNEQTVEVTAEDIPLLQTQNASVGQTVDAAQINSLPLNGRNYYFLAQTAAGVTTAQNGSRGEDQNGRFVANGVRATQNDYLLDEIDNNSAIISVQNGKDYVIQTPVDALADFKIQTNDYNAEFGRAAGAVLNATVKSGTNSFHGDVWEFLRNDVLDANDYFQNQAGLKRPPFRRNQYGFTLGGPVWLPHIYDGHNRTFFFGDYEGTRISQGNTLTTTVPTLQERNSGFTDFSDLLTLQTGNNKPDAAGNVYPFGTIFDPSTTKAYGSSYVRSPFPNNKIPSNRIDPNAVALLNLLPAPTFPTLLANYVTSPTNTDQFNNFDIRIDQVIGGKDYLFARYSYNGHTQNHPGPYSDYQQGYADGGNSSSLSNYYDRAQNVSIGETHTFNPNVVNDLRLGVNREHVLWLQPNGNTLGIPAKFGIQGVPQYPTNGGLPSFFVGIYNEFGSFNYMPSNKYGTTPQLNDDLTVVRGEHTLKFGVEQQFIQFPYTQPPQSRGEFSFSGNFTSVYGQTDGSTGIGQMLLLPTANSNIAGANQVALSTFTEHALTHKYFGAYAQDDWRVNRKLTLNLGVRYDFYDFMHERHGNIANFVPGPNRQGGTYLVTSTVNKELPQDFISALQAENITVQQTDQNSLVNVPRLNFAPRVGFEYEMNDRFVIRGGFGIFYGGIEDIGGSPLVTENFPIEYDLTQTAINGATPLAANNSLGLLENTFSNLSIIPSAVKPSGINLQAFEKDAKTTASEGYNLALQYQLTHSLALTVAYVGDVTRHIETVMNLNAVGEILPPTVTNSSYVPYQTTALGGNNFTSTGGASDFNAAQVTLEQRPTHGLTLLTNFALQKTLTDARDPLEGTTGGYRAPFLPNFGIKADTEHADFDVHRIFHFSGTYEIPVGNGKTFLGQGHGLTQAVLGGWVTNFIATAEDGMPFTVGCSVTTASGLGCNALLVPGQHPYQASSVSHFVNATAFSNPGAATAIGQSDYSPLGGQPTQVTGPSYRRLDFSLVKQTNITKRVYTEFRAEFFNITNTANFANPSQLNISDTTSFGRITSTVDSPNDPRQIQLALKLYW